MGKYTQTIREYLEDMELDPFKDEDLLAGAKTLGLYYYDGIPEPVMDKLYVRFMRKRMRREMCWLSVDEFRLDLIEYANDREAWYTTMFNVYKDLLPYEMLNSVSETERSDRTGNRVKSDQTQENKTKALAKGENINDNDQTVNQKDVSIAKGSNTGENIATDFNNSIANSYNSDNSKGGTKDSSETNNRNDTRTKRDGTNVVDAFNKTDDDVKGTKAAGIGSIASFDKNGALIKETGFDGTKTDGKLKMDSKTTEDGLDVVGSKTYDKGTNRGISRNLSIVIGKDGTITRGRNMANTKAHNEQRNRGNSENKTKGKQTTKNKNNAFTFVRGNTKGTVDTFNRTKGKQTTTTKGMVVWKPELARKFYDQYVSIDNEWVEGTEDLFLMIY